jgi:UDP-N-acetyl-D-mannosaminuronate dehydrogenase
MHICFPYSDKFVDYAEAYIKDVSPKLTIIHSTVKPGTTKELIEKTSDKIVFSPVMGKHPDLTNSILTFRKIVSGLNEDVVQKAVVHFANIGVRTSIYKKPEEAEFAKILSTTRYGLEVYYLQRVKQLCEEYDMDFEKVYVETTKTYNEGYTDLGYPHFKRPELKFMGYGIGRHCVTSNAYILHLMKEDMEIPKIIGSAGYNIPEQYKDEPKYKIKDWLFCEYVGKEKSTQMIGEECGVTSATIRKYLHNFKNPSSAIFLKVMS